MFSPSIYVPGFSRFFTVFGGMPLAPVGLETGLRWRIFGLPIIKFPELLFPVSEGRTKTTRCFIARATVISASKAPEGPSNPMIPQAASVVPAGTRFPNADNPSDESLGYGLPPFGLKTAFRNARDILACSSGHYQFHWKYRSTIFNREYESLVGGNANLSFPGN